MNKNDLWVNVLKTAEFAINSGSLKPFDTKLEFLDCDEYKCELRYLLGKPRTQNLLNGPQLNPFLPWDTNLEISEISKNHVLILNKYPVELGHMLLISKDWQPQNGWLSLEDWEALTQVEENIKGFWFFNNSPLAGASQPHKHFQLLRRLNEKCLFPRQKWFETKLLKSSLGTSLIDRSCLVLPRYHTGSYRAAKELNKLYLDLCISMEIGNPIINKKPIYSYNLLISSKWIALIRRSKESYKGFSINALGFAGYFLATKNSDIGWIKEKKPISILNEVVLPI